MVKFTKDAPYVPPTDQPISVSLTVDGAVTINLQRGNVAAQPLRICANGKVARICGQEDRLKALGLQVDDLGYILMNN